MKQQQLSRRLLDIECILGLGGKKFTAVGALFSFLTGIVLFGIVYGPLFFFRGSGWGVDMFFHGGPEDRSVIPYVTVFLGCWALAILLIKLQKLHVQRKALELKILPDDANFVLTCATAKEILENIGLQVVTPRDFVLLDRIQRALMNLKNLGNVSAVAECLNTQAQNDEDYLSSTYTVLKGFIWAIPVLGFIGTVLGLAKAIGGFGAVVKKGVNDPQELIAALGNVTGGLSIAFETTLIALVIALIIQLLMTVVLNKEERFLDECSDYCHRCLISKIKSVDLADDTL